MSSGDQTYQLGVAHGGGGGAARVREQRDRPDRRRRRRRQLSRCRVRAARASQIDGSVASGALVCALERGRPVRDRPARRVRSLDRDGSASIVVGRQPAVRHVLVGAVEPARGGAGVEHRRLARRERHQRRRPHAGGRAVGRRQRVGADRRTRPTAAARSRRGPLSSRASLSAGAVSRAGGRRCRPTARRWPGSRRTTPKSIEIATERIGAAPRRARRPTGRGRGERRRFARRRARRPRRRQLRVGPDRRRDRPGRRTRVDARRLRDAGVEPLEQPAARCAAGETADPPASVVRPRRLDRVGLQQRAARRRRRCARTASAPTATSRQGADDPGPRSAAARSATCRRRRPTAARSCSSTRAAPSRRTRSGRCRPTGWTTPGVAPLELCSSNPCNLSISPDGSRAGGLERVGAADHRRRSPAGTSSGIVANAGGVPRGASRGRSGPPAGPPLSWSAHVARRRSTRSRGRRASARRPARGRRGDRGGRLRPERRVLRRDHRPAATRARAGSWCSTPRPDTSCAASRWARPRSIGIAHDTPVGVALNDAADVVAVTFDDNPGAASGPHRCGARDLLAPRAGSRSR